MSTLSQIKMIAVQARHTLLQDAMGAVALMIMLLVGLHIPSFY